jgi:two-component system, cell cycle sensor histidine kinase and response regulator CckA
LNTFEKADAPDLISALVESGNGSGENLGQLIPAELIRDTLDSLPDPLLVFDAAQNIVFANAAATRFLTARNTPLGASREGFLANLNIFDSVTQNLLAPEKLPAARALAGETVDRAEYAVRPVHQGVPFWLECGARPLRGTAGDIRGAVVIFRDITSRKNRELALESADQLREFIYEGNLTGILHTTVDGRILDCNDAIVRMFGYSSREEMQGIRAPQLYVDPAQRERLVHLVSVSPDVREFEIAFRRRDNSRGWALISTRLLDPRPGQVGGSLVSLVVDITDRKLWEDTLRQSQQRFTAFMRYLPGVAFIKDLNWKYVYYNDAAWPLFHKRSEDIIGKTYEEIWPREDAALYRANDAAVIESGRPIEFMEPATHPDGVHTWLTFKFPIMENGKPVLVGGIGIDITERRILEDQLTQARKMEALGRLAGGIAHDFNNLLTVISGYGQLAIEGLASLSEPRLTGYLQEILNSAQRASGLTGQLLAFSRRQSVQPRVFDLCGLLSGVERLLLRMIGEHVDLTVRCGPEPCLIRADAHQIEQVLMNLAVNARDAMPLGGTLEIECHLLLEPIERPGQLPLNILLEVRDNGVGMDKAVKARMFEPFFTSKDQGKGTGLGLSTVYGVVAQAGGQIEVDSEPGQGSQFRLYFPSALAEPGETPPLAGGLSAGGLETVLLVEDEQSVRALAETILKKLGYNVLVADSGKTALEIFDARRDSIDIVLTDVIMPHMSGGDLAHKLRELNPRLKILFMSGYTDDMIASHGVLAGETQLIQKPFTAEALGRKLRAVLDA